MDILRTPLIILFKEQNPYGILEKYYNSKNEITTNNNIDINKQMFIHLCNDLESGLSKDEIMNLYEIVQDKMKCKIQGLSNKKSVFNLIANYDNDILYDYGYTARCNYKDLLKWRAITLKLDPDMFLCSFFAYNDLLRGYLRNNFDWETIIKSDNIRLHGILSRGMAENHFHLNGSAPTFKLSWISLMNDINVRNISKINIEDNRLERDNDGQVDINDLISIAVIIRIILFKKLLGSKSVRFDNHKQEKIKDKSYKYDLESFFEDLINYRKEKNSFNINKSFMKLYKDRLQREISKLKYLYGAGFKYKDGICKVDYAIVKTINRSSRGIRLFVGERWLLYNCFKKIYTDDKDTKMEYYEKLFYVYLIIKNKVRGEMIQSNEKVGYSNFANYQERKTKYIRNNTFLRSAIEPSAVLTSIKTQNIISLEARVVPENTLNESINFINEADKNICNNVFNDSDNYWINQYNSYEELKNDKHNLLYKDLSAEELNLLYDKKKMEEINEYLKSKYFYVYHFPKKFEEKNFENDKLLNSYRCRHYKYRKEVKNWAMQIYNMRENNQKEALRILGIDACASELAARPEVFAQAFRFLKNHMPSLDYLKEYRGKYSMKVLRATYHVGEDFLDVVDGLRAVDEAVKFLDLKHGDRLGHAIVLGINPSEWYESKDNRVYLSKQQILDNAAWLIGKIKEYDIKTNSDTIEKLLSIYNKYYCDLFIDKEEEYTPFEEDKNSRSFRYGSDKSVVPVDIYVKSWKLRGDNPEWYMDGNKFNTTFSRWDRYAVQKREYNGLVCELYYRYHYDYNVREKGNRKKAFKIYNYIVDAIGKVQKCMQNSLRKRGIGIETNPSSNVLISTFKRYDKHPIINMYNKELVTSIFRKNASMNKYEDNLNLLDSAQLFVSINTDDQGVFDTLLENEYALMGIALEKVKDKDGNYLYNQADIYDWIDSIRRMGIEQNFRAQNIKST